jgi:integrase
MTKREKTKHPTKRKGGRQPVAFVIHPDTGQPVSGLRIHKSTGSYYRIEADKKSRHYYKKSGRVGLAYQRRAIYEHECWQLGQEPTDIVAVNVTGGRDDFGDPVPRIATFDDAGNPVNVTYLSKEDMAAYFREKLSNPATRKEFAEMVGFPELLNLHLLQAPPEPLTLPEMIDRYVQDKSFAQDHQSTDSKTKWQMFVQSVGVDTFDNITNDGLQRYKSTIENKYALRTQKNHYNVVQAILSHSADVYKEHRSGIEELKSEIRRNCQKWSQDKKTKARKKQPKPMPIEHFRTLLDAAKNESKLAYALFLSAANFALHGKEAADLKHSDINLDTLELNSSRSKSGVTRVAIIWQETARAIKEFQQSDENNHHPDYVFVNGDGKPMNIHKLNRLVRKLRKAAHLPDTIVFDGIRDMTRTAMGAENLLAAKWVMGHSTGEDDTYAFRMPTETRKALTKARKAILGE